MAEIFVSYARANEPLAKRVAAALKANGFDVWRDDQLPTHRAYSDIIEQKLRSATAVVVLWSKDSVNSQWVRAEAELARNEGKLVQGLLDGTMPPLPFNQIQCANLKRWGGSLKHPGWLRLLEGVNALAGGDRIEPAKASRWDWLRQRSPWVAGLAAVFLGAALLYAALQYFAPAPGGSTTLAVLPFKPVAAADDALAYGLWEDTRQALSRNPQLLVLGPNTAEELARKGPDATKRAADYVVEASVRSAGGRLRLNANLVRTEDGAQMWSESFERPLDDVFKLQQQIAGEIEGRIRGRLAERGGRLPEHIATSGEVYAIYSDARAKIRNRHMDKYEEAYEQLREVVRRDPNFAPGWATLSVVKTFKIVDRAVSRTEAEADARRAIALAPNLAAGHAALGLALGREGPAAESALVRALALDPNDIEAMLWLATALAQKGNSKAALDLYGRILDIEPLWWTAVLNRLDLLLTVGDKSAVDEEIARLDRLGDVVLASRARLQDFKWRGDYSEAVKMGLVVYRRGTQFEKEFVRDDLARLLLQLGYPDEAWRFSRAPPGAASVWRSEPAALDKSDSMNVPPAAFWNADPGAEVSTRARVELGRGARVAHLYKAGAGSPQRLRATLGHPDRFLYLAPLVAIALRQAGEPAEAERLLAAADQILGAAESNQIGPPGHAVHVARVRAVQGRLPEGATALLKAVERGWLPPAPHFRPDLQADPPLRLLKDLPQFQQARSRILAHVARERRELGPTLAAVRAAAPTR